MCTWFRPKKFGRSIIKITETIELFQQRFWFRIFESVSRLSKNTGMGFLFDEASQKPFETEYRINAYTIYMVIWEMLMFIGTNKSDIPIQFTNPTTLKKLRNQKRCCMQKSSMVSMIFMILLPIFFGRRQVHIISKIFLSMC